LFRFHVFSILPTGAHYTLLFRQLDEQRMDSGSRFAELTVIGKNERYLR
jgi:hypothetical protein